MIFTSLSYFFCLPLVYLIFYFSADRYRWLVLLIASYVFYATFKAPQLLLSLATVTAISYFCGIRLANTEDEIHQKRVFWLGIVSCVLILAVMKYLPLFLGTRNTGNSSTNLLISVGVSYFAFQAISYMIDIYLEIQKPELHPGYHALYLAFFPKLLQGPIERGGDLLPQLHKPYEFDYNTMRSAVLLFTCGLFKKLVLADRLALLVNPVYNDVHAYSGLPLLVATYAFALQIYLDFSGYTDMARGTARMFGVSLTENFNSPYLAISIADFWRRWHISFSRWILDYIFKPLQMAWRDHSTTGTAFALLVTFFASGLWHGASWGFVIWGLLHGVYLAASTYYRPYQKKLHKWLGVEKSKWLQGWQVFVTFNLVSFTWIFFRAGSVGDGLYVVTHLFSWHVAGTGLQTIGTLQVFEYFRCDLFVLIVSIWIILLLNGIMNKLKLLSCGQWFFRWSVYIALVSWILLFQSDSATNFLYMKY